MSEIRRQTMRQTRWEDLTFHDRMRVFNYWSLLQVISNFMQIFACTTFLLREYIPFAYNQFFIGVGCMLCWVCLIRYSEHSSDFSILSRTLNHAIPEILANMLSTIPVFIGFALLGVSIFWNVFRFRFIGAACWTLFGLMLGDEVGNTYAEMIQSKFLAGIIYITAFTFFAVTVIMNIFLVII
jgi:hypothetical protein